MDIDTKNYLIECRKNFDRDVENGCWGCTPKELSENKKLIGETWMSNHNHNEEYWNILYGDIKNNPKKWEGKICLDYGSGFGGNIENLFSIANWGKVIGCEISGKCVLFSRKYLKAIGINKQLVKMYKTDGISLNIIQDEYVDFVTSIVVLQHIALHKVRFNILQEFYRVLKKKGVLSFQMNKSHTILSKDVEYYNNKIPNNIKRPNCTVENPEYVVNDLKKIGFSKVEYIIGKNPALNRGKNNDWTYFKAIK